MKFSVLGNSMHGNVLFCFGFFSVLFAHIDIVFDHSVVPTICVGQSHHF
jgi:hypothetical protein